MEDRDEESIELSHQMGSEDQLPEFDEDAVLDMNGTISAPTTSQLASNKTSQISKAKGSLGQKLSAKLGAMRE